MTVPLARIESYSKVLQMNKERKEKEKKLWMALETREQKTSSIKYNKIIKEKKKKQKIEIKEQKNKSKHNSIYFVVAGDAWVAEFEFDGRIAVAAWLRNCV